MTGQVKIVTMLLSIVHLFAENACKQIWQVIRFVQFLQVTGISVKLLLEIATVDFVI